ncbi:hypothetical protein [Deinococcus sp.]|uniref:hypothetical protein n=1 Tax=Deinococcus sp. TaxID=47478 RepID=UPI0025BFA2AA|nr:hypothetical protein [Deinococcus sp.]
MPSLVALLPLAGFFLALTAFWCRSRAHESAVDADLQRRLGEHTHSQAQPKQDETPFEVSQWLLQQKTRYSWLAAILAILALGCFAGTFVLLGYLH